LWISPARRASCCAAILQWNLARLPLVLSRAIGLDQNCCRRPYRPGYFEILSHIEQKPITIMRRIGLVSRSRVASARLDVYVSRSLHASGLRDVPDHHQGGVS